MRARYLLNFLTGVVPKLEYFWYHVLFTPFVLIYMYVWYVLTPKKIAVVYRRSSNAINETERIESLVMGASLWKPSRYSVYSILSCSASAVIETNDTFAHEPISCFTFMYCTYGA